MRDDARGDHDASKTEGPIDATETHPSGVPRWSVVCVLPNLALPEYHPDDAADVREGVWQRGITLDTDDVVVVPPSEPRAVEAAAASPAVTALLSAFRGEQGEQVSPAVLMARDDGRARRGRSWEPFVSFRNAIAMSFLLKGRAGSNDGSYQPTWSDTFDFHPTFPDARGTLSTFSPALHSFGLKPEKFHAAPSPYMPRVGRRMFADRTLYTLLGSEWRRRFGEEAHDDLDGRALWRSLEHAYSALSASLKHQESVHDYGMQLGLWVTAVEVLTWPKHQHANLPYALDLLEEFDWHSEVLKERREVKINGKVRRELNAVQLVYLHIYRSRNDFLHGNEVNVATFFRHVGEKPADEQPVEAEAQRSLVNLAAVVYRTALVAYLRRRYRVSGDDPVERVDEAEGEPEISALMSSIFDDWDYHQALEESLGIEDDLSSREE